MSSHDDLLEQGPRVAPDAQTATQRSRRNPILTAVGVVVAGAVILLKLILGKLIFIAVVWAGIVWAAHIGGWLGILLIVAIVVAALAYAKAHIT